jgi:hypothetical protein
MKTLVQVGTALAVVVLCASDAAAAWKKYGSESGWDIYVSDKMGPGCLITRNLNANSLVQMGVDKTTAPGRGYIAVYTKAAVDVAAGQKRSVIIDVDGERFNGEATGQKMQGLTGAYVWLNNPDLVYGLAKKHTLTIMAEGRQPVVLSLDGTYKALKALHTCQDGQ